VNVCPCRPERVEPVVLDHVAEDELVRKHAALSPFPGVTQIGTWHTNKQNELLWYIFCFELEKGKIIKM